MVKYRPSVNYALQQIFWYSPPVLSHGLGLCLAPLPSGVQQRQLRLCGVHGKGVDVMSLVLDLSWLQDRLLAPLASKVVDPENFGLFLSSFIVGGGVPRLLALNLDKRRAIQL